MFLSEYIFCFYQNTYANPKKRNSKTLHIRFFGKNIGIIIGAVGALLDKKQFQSKGELWKAVSTNVFLWQVLRQTNKIDQQEECTSLYQTVYFALSNHNMRAFTELVDQIQLSRTSLKWKFPVAQACLLPTLVSTSNYTTLIF